MNLTKNISILVLATLMMLFSFAFTAFASVDPGCSETYKVSEIDKITAYVSGGAYLAEVIFDDGCEWGFDFSYSGSSNLLLSDLAEEIDNNPEIDLDKPITVGDIDGVLSTTIGTVTNVADESVDEKVVIAAEATVKNSDYTEVKFTYDDETNAYSGVWSNDPNEILKDIAKRIRISDWEDVEGSIDFEFIPLSTAFDSSDYNNYDSSDIKSISVVYDGTDQEIVEVQFTDNSEITFEILSTSEPLMIDAIADGLDSVYGIQGISSGDDIEGVVNFTSSVIVKAVATVKNSDYTEIELTYSDGKKAYSGVWSNDKNEILKDIAKRMRLGNWHDVIKTIYFEFIPLAENNEVVIASENNTYSDLPKCKQLSTGDIDSIKVTGLNAYLGEDKVTIQYKDTCVFSYQTSAYKIDSSMWKRLLIEEIAVRLNTSKINVQPPVTYSDIAQIIEFQENYYPNDPIPEITYWIESGDVVVDTANRKITAEVSFGLDDDLKVIAPFRSKQTVLDDVLLAINNRTGRVASYVDRGRITIEYTNEIVKPLQETEDMEKLRLKLNELIVLLTKLLKLKLLLSQ